MLNTVLAGFYERDLQKLSEELRLFRDENKIWKTAGAIRNSSGNLALHIIGGLNFLIGHQLGKTGYLRDRDREFSEKNVDRSILVDRLQELSAMIHTTLTSMPASQLESPYPIPFDGDQRSIGYVLVQLLAHTNYHLGQVNYLRRMLDNG